MKSITIKAHNNMESIILIYEIM